MLKSLDERLEILTKAIMEDAQSDSEKVRNDAQQKAEEILRDAKAQAEVIRKEILDRAHQEANVLKEEKLSEEKMKSQMMWLERREVLLDKVFQEAYKRIPALVSSADYASLLENLVLETVRNIQSDQVILHFDPKSQALVNDDMIQRITEKAHVKLTIGIPLESGTGVTAETQDGKRRYDNTLESRLQRQQNQLRASVYHIMMGENV